MEELKMSENMFEKWNQSVDLTGLKNDIAEAKENGGGDYEKVPHGEYEVKLEKLELKPTKKDCSPMVSAWFTILNGKYKNFKLFMNQVITQGFQIHICNQFLDSLETGIEVEFVDYKQYGELLLDIAEACDEQGLEFALKYEDNKGYDKFTITEVFEG